MYNVDLEATSIGIPCDIETQSSDCDFADHARCDAVMWAIHLEPKQTDQLLNSLPLARATSQVN